MKLVGKVKEAHGLKGDLYILVFSGDISWLPKLKEIYLKNHKSSTEPQKFEVERVKPFKLGFIVKAKGIDDRNASEAIKAYEVYIPEELLVAAEGETIFLGEILNFALKNPTHDTLGEITGFSSNGVQDLLQVKKVNGGQAEVPFVEAFLKKIDFKNRLVVMDLPEGLLDLDQIED